MKLIKPSFEVWEQSSGLEGIYNQIERAGRVCYKSEDKITEDSAKPFVERMIKSGHGAMLEHGTVYLMKESEFINTHIHPEEGEEHEYNPLFKYCDNPYSYVVEKDNIAYITTNLRVLVENNWLDDLKYICEPTEFHEKRITVHFICDRGVSHEFVRHRVMSFAQESTRYCNYSKDKFGNKLTFIIPCWCDDIPDASSLKDSMDVKKFVWGTDNLAATVEEKGVVNRQVSKFTQRFLYEMQRDEDTYIGLIAAGYKPQEARAVLPNALKTELVMTGFINDWKRFFDLRCATNAHPQAQELAIPLREEFVKKGYMTDNK